MRNKISVLYYPDMTVSETTLKKCILFFDEIHFMDRPALTIGNFGLIGAPSPFRTFEKLFRDDAGVPLYVHGITGNKFSTDLLERVYADIGDELYINNFRQGLLSSSTFRAHQFPEGDYGSFGKTQMELISHLTNADLSILNSPDEVEQLLKKNITTFDKSNPEAVTVFLLKSIMLCSARINLSLTEGARRGYIPLADAAPYSMLLNSQYMRAAHKLDPLGNNINISDFSFAIFDELISNEAIEKMDIVDVVRYRKKSEKAREEFLEYLASIQEKQANVPMGSDYNVEIKRLIKTEIMPAAISFRKKLQNIDDAFTKSFVKRALSSVGGGTGVSIFTDLSWEKVISLAVAAGCIVLDSFVDKYYAERALMRECSISYVLSLDQ